MPVFLLMCVAATVCVVQFGVLGSWARSLRTGTLLLAVSVGFAACGTVAVLLQLAWTRAFAAITGTPLRSVVDVAAYTVDPAIEEVVKVLPLVALAIWWRDAHRQLGLVDHLLAGAALGVGFELFEAALRHSTIRGLTFGVPGGWLVSGNLGGTVTVPSLWTSLTSWQPAPAAFQALLDPTSDTVQHLVWTALAAAGLGWAVRRPGPWRWAGVAGLVVATLDHANYNLRAARAVPALLAPVSEALEQLGGQLHVVLLVVLVAAVLLDRRTLATALAAHPAVRLDGEGRAGTGRSPLVDVALAGTPWSAYATWRFVLARRAFLFAAATGRPDLEAAVTADRVRLDAARSRDAWRDVGRRWADSVPTALVAALRAPTTLVWLVACLPAALYLVVGAFPATSALQRLFRGQVGFWLLVLAAVAAVANLVLQVRAGAAAVRSAPRPAVHEHSVRAQERLAAAAGGLVAAVPLLLQALLHRDANRSVVTNYHALDALGTALLILGLALLVASFFLFPPFGFAVTTAGTMVLVPTLTEAFVVTAAGSATLGGLGILLNEAADGSTSSSGSGPEGSTDAAARQQRIEELARDPANGGRITTGSTAEAEVGVGLEESGQVQGLRRSANAAEEFIDAQGRPWDVKAFHSEYGRFDLDVAMRKISQEMNWSKENIMLDTRNLSASDLARLREAVEAAKAGGELPLEVLWWP